MKFAALFLLGLAAFSLAACGTFDPDPCGCVVRSPDCPDTPTPEECEKEAEPSADAGAAAHTSTWSK